MGLIYLETGAFEKAAMAFEQALEIEGDIPARYMALAKAKENLGQKKEALEALENAYSLDNNTAILRQILAIHEAAGDMEAVAATTARIEKHLADVAAAKAAKTKKSPVRKTLRPAPKMVRRPTRPTKPVRTPAKTVTSPKVRRPATNASRRRKMI